MEGIVNIESKYSDREVTLNVRHCSPLLTVKESWEGKALFAYLTPHGARTLINALEPLAGAKHPPIDVAEVLNELLP